MKCTTFLQLLCVVIVVFHVESWEASGQSNTKSKQQKSKKPTEATSEKKEVEPDPDEYVSVDKEPDINAIIAQVNAHLQYPEIARRAGVEGQVLIKVLLTKDGKPKKHMVVRASSEFFEKPALEAVMKIQANPVLQNGKPVEYWVTIPVAFRLRKR